MKKTVKKVLVSVAAAALAAGACLSLAACGGTPAAAPSVKDTYNANPGSQGTVNYRTAPMKMIDCNTECITVYTDNTYRFNVTSTIITGIGVITDNEGALINRGAVTIEYYGTYTQTVDSGVTLLTVSVPTRLTIDVTDSTFTGGFPVGRFDTAAWRDTDTEALKTWYNTMVGEGEATSENILKKFAYEETEIAVSEKNMFDYLRVSYFNIAMGAMGF